MSDKKSLWDLPTAGPGNHSRQAAHFRALAENATTGPLNTADGQPSAPPEVSH